MSAQHHNATRPAGQDGQGPSAAAPRTHQCPPAPTSAPIAAPIRAHHHRDNNKKANITIATLNVNGFTAPSSSLGGIEKWATIVHTMNKLKIAILAIQETHLDDPRLDDVRAFFERKITIIASHNPVSPRTSAGVAFILNKKLIKPKEVTYYELQEGHALALKVKWHESGEEDTTLLNIYAPNNRIEHGPFWENIETKRRLYRLRHPEFMLGDFNVTEDNIDRAPAHPDDPNAITALREIRHKWELQDAWRHSHPTERCFTYRNNANGQQIQSRLDRIYTARGTARHTYGWHMGPTPTPTDHWIVTVKYSPRDAPIIGPGRWTWPTPSLQRDKLMTRVVSRGIQLQNDITKIKQENTPREMSNPQLLWRAFKQDITTIAKALTKESSHKINSRINTLEKDRKELTAHPEFDTNDGLRSSEAIIAHEITHLTQVNSQTEKEILHAKLANHGERLGGIWSAISKESKPHDLIKRLKIPNSNPPQYERCSKKMSHLALEYHRNLQQDGLTNQENNEEYEHLLEAVLNTIPENQRMREPLHTPLNRNTTEAQVEEALRLSKNGSATGLDGCPYELWKSLHSRYITARQMNKEGFNIVNTLTELINDIQNHGVDPNSDFANGWMCPIYKKKDPADISNYRPITLMNTDYKILTKTLAIQLMEPLPNLVHEDQAGFIPKRSIFNHIRLARSIINYAEVMEVDGAIIALDQEKAYDKIRHDYLWKTLEAFHIPQPFINTVRALYQHAHTQVAINGVLSDPFHITRGVRQGDPLSCTLFDLAIEPLACMIRDDPHLRGIGIPGIDNILITLFADDTTLFLNKNDRLDDAQRILDQWCRVSGAKFNLEKTEIIPIGTKEHRSTIITTRKVNPLDQAPLHDLIRIARDGEATRSLGAWIRNHTHDLTPWETILDKIHKALERWRQTRPTLQGRKLIIQTIVGGHTQFLTKAQGMPPTIENALTKMTCDFLWEDDSSPRIALSTLHQPIEQGGLNLLDLQARNEAIEITWLKAYLNLSPSRPTWAKITDLIINASAPPGTSRPARINSFLQSWNPPTKGPRSALLDDDTVRMLKAAKKHHTNLAAIRLSPNLRAQLPAWYHLSAEKRPLTTTTAKCLLTTHRNSIVADLISMSARLRDPERLIPHIPSPQCPCTDCINDRDKHCLNPHACATEAQHRINLIAPKLNPLAIGDNHGNLSLTPSRKERNHEARQTDGHIQFDPSITCKNNLAECFRIFTDPNKISTVPARQHNTQGANHRHHGITIYTDGACNNNGKLNAQCGSGIWFGPEHEQNLAVRVPGPQQSNQIGEIAAIIAAVNAVPRFQPLTIVSDSRYAIEGLTTHLQKWEDDGWIGIKNAAFFKRTAFLLRSWTATTNFKWVKGHNGNLGNEQSDQLARNGANKPEADILPLEIPNEFDLQGAKLATITQATAYRGIRERKTNAPRPTTTRNIQSTRDAIHIFNGNLETDESLWKGIRNRNIRTKIQQFLYKTMHGTQKIGSFWRNINNYETRQSCNTCDEIETMEHILIHCNAAPSQIIWDLAKNLWPHPPQFWPDISLGIILGCGSIRIPEMVARATRPRERNQATAPKGATRLLHILLSESAHLIWVLRCERVIQNIAHTTNEIKNRWTRAINIRLTDDKITATRIKRDTRSIQTAKNTWEHVLSNQMDLPTDWISSREVLVGRRVRALHP